MAHDSNWINWRKPRLERDCTRQTEHPVIMARMDKTNREAVLKMLVSSPFDSRLSVMEYLQGLFALLRIAGENASAAKEAIYHATELFKTRQGCKRLLREIQRPEKRPKYNHGNVSIPLAKVQKEESALLRLWKTGVRQALLRRNKPLKVWTTKSRLLTLAVLRYKKVVNRAKQNVINKAKQRNVRGHTRLNEQFKRKAKCRKNDSKSKQVTSCCGPKRSTIDNFIAEIYLSTTTKPTHLQETTKEALNPYDQHKENNTLPKMSNAVVKPQAKFPLSKAKDQLEPRKVPEMTHHAPPCRKRKCDTEPITNSSFHSTKKKVRSDADIPSQEQHNIPSKKSCSTPTPQKVTFKEPIAKEPNYRYKYIKDNVNATLGGSFAEWLRPKENTTSRPKRSHTQAISTKRTTICLRPQDKWMVTSEPISTHPADSRIVCLLPQDRWYEKSQPRYVSLGPYDRWSKSNPNKTEPGFRRPQDKWYC